MPLRLLPRDAGPVTTPWVIGVGGGLLAAGLGWAVQAGLWPQGLPWLVGGLGAGFALLLAATFRALLRSRQRAEQRSHRLAADLDRLALVAERTINLVIITDTRRRITWVNEAFERRTGYRMDEVLGRSPGELLQCEKTDREVIGRMRAALDAGEPFRAELLNRDRQGRDYWVDVQLQPLRDAAGRLEGFMAIEVDTTEQRRLDDALRAQAALLRAAIDAVDEAFVLYDPDDRLALCNDRYRQVYPTSADLLVPGMRFEDIVRIGAQRGQYREAIGRIDDWVAERMRAHLNPAETVLQTTDDGRVLRVRERRLPDGHLVGFRIDITDLMRAREAAEQADRAKSDFIATISHELRTPLQSIIGFSELGQDATTEQPRLKRLFDRVQEGGQRMLTLVDGLLDIAKLDGAAGTLALARGDLGAMALAVLDELRPQLDARGLGAVVPQPMPELPALLHPFRIQQVLRNVLANAIRFAPTGSRIELEAWREPAPPGGGAGGVVLAVRDHGPGIPPEELEAIFEPFVQSSRTRDGSGGTGLGLTICRRIVSAHGGTITAANAEGGGARLRLWLPAVDVAAVPPPSGTPAPSDPGTVPAA